MASTAALRFNPTWVELPEFKDWLVSVSNDISRAYCRWCAVVLRAHKSDLTTHSTTQRHVKNESRRETAPSGPISVQIVPNDDDDEGKEDPAKKSKTSFRSPSTSPYTKRYRAEWEALPELKNWLTSCSSDATKAWCNFCNLQLRAHKHDLLVHGNSTKHKRMEETGGVTDVLENGEEEHGGDDSSQKRNSRGQFASSSALISAEFEDGSNGGDNDDHDYDWTPPSPPPRKTPTPKQARPPHIYGPPSTRSPRSTFSAADVVRAIERDEFTGYQLLSIVKAAVPKL